MKKQGGGEQRKLSPCQLPRAAVNMLEKLSTALRAMTHLFSPMPRTAIISARNREVSRDLLFVVLATALTFVVCAVFQLREWLTDITRPLERYQIDELPFTLGALAVLLAWFSWRRWRQAAHELQ